jgi:CRISPR-associated protein Csb2
MAFAIVADLPLGTYRGAGPDGRPEPVPSVARLHSALLCAAGFGPRAVEADPGALDLAAADAAALRWLEANPPDSVHIPALEVSPGGAVAYRDDGTFTKAPQPGKLTTRKLAKAPNAGSAVNGQFMWIWQQEPPEPVRDVLAQLCPDVPYLGTTESPVRLTAVSGSGLRSTHDLKPDAGLFTAGGIGIDRPVEGRVDELSQAHREATATPPSAAKDKHKTGEDSRSAVPPRKSVETAWYCPRLPDAPGVPWSRVIAIPIDAPVPAKARVAWAVAAHRALTKIAGDGAPAVITGAYAAGVRRPANRIALHLLDAATGAEAPGPCLLVMVPAGTEPADLGVLQRAVMQLSVLRGPQGKARRLDTSQIRVLDGSRFWSPPAPGTIRLWRTVPAAVPETRGPRDGEWNFAHAALLSLGFAWKDQHRLPRVQGRGDAYHRGLAAAVSEAGVAVVHTKAVRTGDVDRYVHKVNEHAVVRPYTACLSLGSLAGPGTILAIGQSRHLGGGLLIPLDVPEGTAVTDIRLPQEGGA